MSMLENIISKIFGPSAATAATPEPAPAGTSTAAAPSLSTAAAPAQVDIAEVLDKMAAQTGQKLNWRSSIVDLMKLVGLDSSLAARKELATDLHYTGDPSDSGAMNVWLHKQVMMKLAANGGKVPDDLK